MTDLDKRDNGYQNLAPWGSTVRGSPFGRQWVKVGQRYLPRYLDSLEEHGRKVEVLLLQEEDKDDDEMDFGEDRLTWRWLKQYILGPKDQAQLWEGCTEAERTRRITSVLKRSTQTLLGTAITGVIVGCAMLPLRMEALSQIGLANLCASVTVPSAILGLFPVMIARGFGPTRVRRRALNEFWKWIRAGRPRGHNPDNDLETMGRMVSMKGVVAQSPQSPNDAEHDWRAPGEIAAEELGFPFTLAVRSCKEHLRGLVLEMKSMLSRRKAGDDWSDTGSEQSSPPCSPPQPRAVAIDMDEEKEEKAAETSPDSYINTTAGFPTPSRDASRWETPPATPESHLPQHHSLNPLQQCSVAKPSLRFHQ